MIDLRTKFEVSTFTRYVVMTDIKNAQNGGGLGWFCLLYTSDAADE